jgi:hypothetical protein
LSSMGLAASQTGCRRKGIRAPSFRMTSGMKSEQLLWFEIGPGGHFVVSSTP